MNIRRVEWTDEAAQALACTLHSDETYNAHEHAKRGIESGVMELWRVDASWLVTERRNDVLIVWALVGSNALGILAQLRTSCEAQSIRQIQFATLHKGLPRLLKKFNPRPIAPHIFAIEVAQCHS